MFTREKSKLFRGKGLFSQTDLPPDSVIPENMVCYMNDADFDYPEELNYSRVEECLAKYEITDKNNCLCHDDESACKTRRYVPAGEELTRRYGVKFWGFVLMFAYIGIDYDIDMLALTYDTYTNIMPLLPKNYKKELSRIMEPFRERGYTYRLQIGDNELWNNYETPSPSVSDACVIS